MSADAASYTTDLVYPSAFGAFQAPIHLAHAAALARRAAPAVGGEPFTYCDLGCGAGLTLCVLADCHPEAEFHGVDINVEHVRRARALAAEAGLGNVRFHEADMGALASFDLPAFDFIAVGGVYSWLPPATRAAVLAFAGDRLTERGVLFLHYGALPGNAQVDALYGLLRAAAAEVDGDSLERFTYALKTLRGLRAAKARFFEHNPYAAAWLDQAEGQDPRALAHEALNAQRTSLWAGEVAAEAAAAELVVVADAQLEANDLDLWAPMALRDGLRGATPSARALALDTLRNANSRMDVLMRAGSPPEAEPPALWLDRLTRGPLDQERRTLGSRAHLDLSDAPYTEALALVDGKAAALPHLLGALAARGVREPRTVIERLVALKLLSVLRTPYVRAGGGTRLSRMNTLLLEERTEAAGALPLASPVAGTQLLLPGPDRLALLSMLGADLDDVWRRLQAKGVRVGQSGREVNSPNDLKALASARARQVGPAMWDRLVSLGVLS